MLDNPKKPDFTSNATNVLAVIVLFGFLVILTQFEFTSESDHNLMVSCPDWISVAFGDGYSGFISARKEAENEGQLNSKYRRLVEIAKRGKDESNNRR